MGELQPDEPQLFTNEPELQPDEPQLLAHQPGLLAHQPGLFTLLSSLFGNGTCQVHRGIRKTPVCSLTFDWVGPLVFFLLPRIIQVAGCCHLLPRKQSQNHKTEIDNSNSK